MCAVYEIYLFSTVIKKQGIQNQHHINDDIIVISFRLECKRLSHILTDAVRFFQISEKFGMGVLLKE